jgi:hypothetical protein
MILVELLEALFTTIVDHFFFASLTGSLSFAGSYIVFKYILKRLTPLIYPKLQVVGILLGLLTSLLCIVTFSVLFLLDIPFPNIEATVEDVFWTTYVQVQEAYPITYTAAPGNLPSAAYGISCFDQKYSMCEQNLNDNSNSETEENCRVQTVKYCSYTVDEWKVIQTHTLSGSDLQPIFDAPNLFNNQRLGAKFSEFTVYFRSENGIIKYTPYSVSEFQQFIIGSRWTLKLNLIGGVVEVE